VSVISGGDLKSTQTQNLTTVHPLMYFPTYMDINRKVFHGILFYLYPYVSYMTMAEWNYRNMYVGKYISECTVVKFCVVCVDFKSPPHMTEITGCCLNIYEYYNT